MMVMMAQLLVVMMERLMRSLRMSHTRSLGGPESTVIRLDTIRPEEMGSLKAGDKLAVKSFRNGTVFFLPLNKNRKNVCLLKIVPR